MNSSSKRYQWFALGDLNGFFGLMFDNLTVLSFLAGILVFVFKARPMPASEPSNPACGTTLCTH